MTYEEAMKILHPDTTLTALAEVEYYGGFNGQEAKIKAVEEACLLACKALEKQIPKKPIIRKTEDYFGYVKYILCPNCEEVEFGFNQPCFCERCGQAIDWEVTQ